MTDWDDYTNAQNEILNAINQIRKVLLINEGGKVDGVTINKTNFMNEAKSVKATLSQKWTSYLQALGKVA